MRLAMTGTEVERIHAPRRRRRSTAFVVGQGAGGRAPSRCRPPDASAASTSGREQTTIVCGAPNVAAGQTVAVARPGAVMPDGTKLGRAKLRGVESDGMILAEDELGIGTDHAGHPRARRRASAPGTPLADVLPIATDVLELEITPNRPDCLGVYGVAREVHAATGAPLGPPPWADDPGTTATAAARHRGRRRGARPVPAVHRARLRGRHDRAVAAVAEGAAHGRRPAPDQQRRRHHELRDAADRPSAARVRPRPRRRRPPGGAPRRTTASRCRRSTAPCARSTPTCC